MSKKRRREQPAVDTQLVEIYEDLANVDEKIRLRAAHTLLTNFVSNGKATGDQLNKILRRLIRGLCSCRKAARLGFSIALTEFLTELLGPNGKDVEDSGHFGPSRDFEDADSCCWQRIWTSRLLY